ncbi:MAG: hypothetical protein CMO55_18845 [Verrucomicrobiales bacterium]|nr:hypothetical protein [Verrucomicrobiales bacterium]
MAWRTIFVAVFCCVLVSERTAFGASVSDWLDFPPSFVRLFGDPAIDWKEGVRDEIRLTGVGEFTPKGGFEREVQKPRVVVDASLIGEGGVKERLANLLSERFFEEVIARKNLTMHEKRIRIQELIPMTKEEFAKMSTRRLLRRPGNPKWFQTWWIARMGLPMHPDPNHQLIIMNLHYDREDGKQRAGHFAFAIREKGGNPNRDIVFDFRAEWYLERRATLTEALNLNNDLPMRGYTKNLYDWLYTQTELRNCHADFWFLPVYREQVELFYHFSDMVQVHEAGQFKPIRRNCTTLGLAFLDRVKPFRTPLPLGKGVADVPTVGAKRYLKPYGDVPYIRITNYTDDRGREPTTISKIHRAEPSRATCRPFRELRNFAPAN